MANKIIKIGHASASEYGTASGTAGDSTGKEVYIINEYNISNIEPYIVLRPKSSTIAALSVTKCIDGCNNNNIGYSQTGRNTLYSLAKELNFDLTRVGPCNTDCSAFMTVCAIAAGAKITYGSNAPTTSNMRTRFSQSGDYEVLTHSRYTSMTDYLKAGDILVHENTHTVMVLEDGGEGQTGSDETESALNLQTHNISTSVTDIENTSVTITIKTVKLLNDVESTVNNKSWLYFLEYKKMPGGTVLERQITDNKITLTDLTKNTCYMYRVKVKSGVGTELFYSAHKTFNTLGQEKPLEKLTTVDDGFVKVAYIKAADGYKTVIPYINE